MADKASQYLARIKVERDRQQTLPGSELDGKNAVNDWIAIAGHYLNESATRKSSASYNRGILPQATYEDNLIKAAAVILAALEHADALRLSGNLL